MIVTVIVNIKRVKTLAFLAILAFDMIKLYIMINGHNISRRIVKMIDTFGSGQYDTFDTKLFTVVSKCMILWMPDNTNIHSKQRTAVILAV